ncbi:protein kinase [Planctomycetota bacterium]
MKCPECGKKMADGTHECTYCTVRMEKPPVSSEKAQSASPRAVSKHNTVNTAPPRPTGDIPFSSIGKYKIIRQIGKGAMGRVFLARDPDLERMVAIKTMISGEDASEKSIARFIGEAKSAGKLKHPSIVGVHEIGHIGATHYMVMDFIEGRTLEDLIQEGTITIRRSAEIIRDTARALDYAHEHRIIHRDIKPANIIISKDGSVHLTDFGLARNLESDSSLTKSGEVMGTPVYLNPEQAEGRSKKVDSRSDIYSLGAVFYEMLTGTAPVTGDNLMQIIIQVMDRYPVIPSKLNSKVHKDIEIICMKALSKEPKRRYQSAAEFADDLERFLCGEAISARPASFFYKATRHFKKHSKSTALILVIITASLIALYVQIKKGEQLKNKTAHAVEDRNKLANALVQKLEEERKIWIPLYSEYFYNSTSLPEEWESESNAAIKDKSLFIDGSRGKSAAWFSMPIQSNEWQAEFDARVSDKAPRLNTIGFIVNSLGDFNSGLSLFYGSKSNSRSGVSWNGKQFFSVYKPSTIKRGHTYHFIITCMDKTIRYIVIDTATGETAIDTSTHIPSLTASKHHTHHGFWTEHSQIFIDNIVIRKRGIPTDELLKAAHELKTIIGPSASALYLLKKLESLPDHSMKQACFSKILEYSCASKSDDHTFLSSKIAETYLKLFPDKAPSDLFSGDTLAFFYRITIPDGNVENVSDRTMRKLLKKDSRVTSYLPPAKNSLAMSQPENLAEKQLKRKRETKKALSGELRRGDTTGSGRKPRAVEKKMETDKNKDGVSIQERVNGRIPPVSKHPEERMEDKTVSKPKEQLQALPEQPDAESEGAAKTGTPKTRPLSDQIKADSKKVEVGESLKQPVFAAAGKSKGNTGADAGVAFNKSVESYFSKHSGRYMAIHKKDGADIQGKIESVRNGTLYVSKTEITNKGAVFSKISIPLDTVSLWQKIRLVKPDLNDKATASALYVLAEEEKDESLLRILRGKINK